MILEHFGTEVAIHRNGVLQGFWRLQLENVSYELKGQKNKK